MVKPSKRKGHGEKTKIRAPSPSPSGGVADANDRHVKMGTTTTSTSTTKGRKERQQNTPQNKRPLSSPASDPDATTTGGTGGGGCGGIRTKKRRTADTQRRHPFLPPPRDDAPSSSSSTSTTSTSTSPSPWSAGSSDVIDAGGAAKRRLQECALTFLARSGGGAGQRRRSPREEAVAELLLESDDDDDDDDMDVDGNGNDEKDEDEDEEFRDAVGGLIAHLRGAGGSSGSAAVEEDGGAESLDAAGLLLPWSVREVLARPPRTDGAGGGASRPPPSSPLAWEALRACLEARLDVPPPSSLSSSSPSGASSSSQSLTALTSTSSAAVAAAAVVPPVLASALHASVLHRLVPLAAELALGGDGDNDGHVAAGVDAGERGTPPAPAPVVSASAAACYSLILRSGAYRPTADYAIGTLLVRVDRLLLPLRPSADHRGRIAGGGRDMVAEATLTLVLSLIRGGTAANPRRLFALLAGRGTLPALARLGGFATDSPPAPVTVPGGGGDEEEGGDENGEGLTRRRRRRRAASLVHDILRLGLFHPSHHVGGFVTALAGSGPAPPVVAADGDAPEGGERPSIAAAAKREKGGGGTKKKAKAYQWALVAAVEELLSSSTPSSSNGGGGGDNSDGNSDDDAAAAASLVTPLLEAFLSQLGTWEEEEEAERRRVERQRHHHRGGGHHRGGRSGKGRGGGDTADYAGADAPPMSAEVAKFRLWSALTRPLALRRAVEGDAARTGGGAVALPLLRGLASALDLLAARDDVHRPSFPDPGGRNFAYLSSVAEVVLRRAEEPLRRGGGGVRGENEREEAEALRALLALLSVDHRLLHDRLGRVLPCASSAVSSFSSFASRGGVGVGGGGAELLCAVASTYAKLRQLGHLFRSFLGSISPPTPTPSPSATSASAAPRDLRRALRCGPVRSALSGAVRSCPPGQVHELWDVLDGWLVERAAAAAAPLSADERGADDEDDNAKEDEDDERRGCVVDLFALLIDSVRIDDRGGGGGAGPTSSAGTARALCSRSRATTVPRLATTAGGDVGGSTARADGLRLCGHLLDLDARCGFWLDDDDDDDDGNANDGGGEGEGEGATPATAFDVRSYLLDAARASAATTMTATTSEAEAGALQRLACRRLERLHALVHPRRRAGTFTAAAGKTPGTATALAPSGTGTGTAAELEEEARLLADYCVRAAEKGSRRGGGDFGGSGPEGAGWVALARTVAVWAPYARPSRMAAFLRWVFDALSTEEDDDDGKGGRDGGGEALARSAGEEERAEERAAAAALLEDAAFYEIEEAAGSIVIVGAELVAAVVRVDRDGTEEEERGGGRFRIRRRLSPVARWRRAARIVSILNCLPAECLIPRRRTSSSPVAASDPSPSRIEPGGTLTRLYRIFRDAAEAADHGPVSDAAACLRRSCLAGLARLLAVSSSPLEPGGGGISAAEGDGVPPLDPGDVESQLLASLRSCEERLSERDGAEEEEGQGRRNRIAHLPIASSSGDDDAIVVAELLEACVARCLARDSAPLERFCSVLGRIVVRGEEEGESSCAAGGGGGGGSSARSRASVLLARSAVRRMVVLRGLPAARSGGGRSSEARDLCLVATALVAGKVRDSAIAGLVVAGAESSWTGPPPHGPPPPGLAYCADLPLVLIGDAAVFWGQCAGNAGAEGSVAVAVIALHKALKQVFEPLAQALIRHSETESPSRAKTVWAYHYAISCMSTLPKEFSKSFPCSVEKEVLAAMTGIFVASNAATSPLLDTALCQLVQPGDSAQIQRLTTYLIDNLTGKLDVLTGPTTAASAVHAFRLILGAARGQEQRQLVSMHTSRFFHLAMGLLRPFSRVDNSLNQRDLWQLQVSIAAGFAIDIIRKKELAPLASNEIAMVLGRLVTLLPPIPFKSQGGGGTASVQTYSAVCGVVAALQNNYSKQLYGCAPSIMSVYHSLLSHGLEAENGCSDEKRAECQAKAQELTKLCEMLAAHKDVFKKHAVGLVLDYVDAMESSLLSSAAKRDLAPAVYALLGMCSTYETQQLNIMMSINGRILFRTVLHSYKKNHQYKGQY